LAVLSAVAVAVPGGSSLKVTATSWLLLMS
jgi:hypothetical protein